MLMASDFGVLEVFWSILWLGLFALWLGLVFIVFANIIHAADLSGLEKALWLGVIILIPFLGVVIYIAVRGDPTGGSKALNP